MLHPAVMPSPDCSTHVAAQLGSPLHKYCHLLYTVGIAWAVCDCCLWLNVAPEQLPAHFQYMLSTCNQSRLAAVL
jgi:hypothetical protein